MSWTLPGITKKKILRSVNSSLNPCHTKRASALRAVFSFFFSLEETDYPKEVAKEIKKVVALEGKEGPLSESLSQEGWIIKSEEGVSYEEASEMLGRDKRILENIAGDDLPKDQPFTLCLYEREKPVKETLKPQKAKPDLSGVSLAERKREKQGRSCGLSSHPPFLRKFLPSSSILSSSKTKISPFISL